MWRVLYLLPIIIFILIVIKISKKEEKNSIEDVIKERYTKDAESIEDRQVSIESKINKEELKEDSKNNISYKKKNFITAAEKKFLSILHELQVYELIIVPQINLATIIQKIGNFHYQNELYRNIDFGIFDNNYNILLLIELNDSSHQQNKRWIRDIKVREIVKQADIKLITFYTDKPNRREYVIKRILNELGISQNDNNLN